MLTALQTGVRGGRWHTLIDKVYTEANLNAASEHVIANKGAAGVDHQTTEDFQARQPKELERLRDALCNDTYRPQAIRRTWIPKPGSPEQRPLGIPTVRDRTVQTALRHVLEPIFDNTFAIHSYGFRPGRGCHHALERVEALLEKGYVHIVDADLKSYFDTIPQKPLLDRVREKVSDPRVLKLIEMFIKQGVMDGLKEWTPEEGTPQGAVISPLLANIYLNPLDHLMQEAGFEMTRYADDFVIQCRTSEDAQRALATVQAWVEGNGLTLHPTKTRIIDARTTSFDFLGYRFRGSLRLPRPKSMQKLKDSIRKRTHRANGHSMEMLCASLSKTLKGWFAYFHHCHWNVYPGLDGWVRMRLRSILRKRAGKRGRGRGTDHQRWPNEHFAKLGLCCLTQAHAELCQPSLR